jgi:hypothetical protein
MADESWKSHKNTSLERDMDADHDAQLSEWAPPRIVSTQEIVQADRAQAVDGIDRSGIGHRSTGGNGTR